MQLRGQSKPIRWAFIWSSLVLAAAKPGLGAGGPTEALTLDHAVTRAIAHNRNLQRQRLALQSAEITYRDALDRMFVPSVSLGFSSTVDYTLGQFPGSTASVGSSSYAHGYPSSVPTSIYLSMGQYTIFNFWRDWDAYQSSLIDWKRAQEVFTEAVRSTRLQVVSAFFSYKVALDQQDAAQRSVDIADSIVEVMKSRVRIHQATQNDVASVTVDLLNAKSQYSSVNAQTQSALWQLNEQLGDPIGTPYRIDQPLKYAPISITPEEAVHVYAQQAPNIRTNRAALKKAEIAVKLAETNRLPLPTVSVSGVTLGYSTGYYNGSSQSLASTSTDGANFNVGAAVTFSIPILGPGGFLGERTVHAARINRDISEITLEDQSNIDESTIFSTIATIKSDEDQIRNAKEAVAQSNAILDSLMSQLNRKTLSRLEWRDAVLQARDNEIALNQYMLAHLAAKLQLALLIGIDRLPGDFY